MPAVARHAMTVEQGRALLARSISEKTLQGNLLTISRRLGWAYYHTNRSERSPAGFPDCVLIKPPRLLVLELKRETGKATPEQVRWLELFLACGNLAAVVRPSEMDLVLLALTHPERLSVERNGKGEPVLARRMG